MRQMMSCKALAGRRILVVEDDPLLSMEICTQIEDHGGSVVGPAATLDRGHALLEAGPSPDGGILNIRIGTRMVYPLADILIAACVPIIFASSESRSSIPERFASVPLLGKPLDMITAVEKLFSAHDEV